MSDEAGLLLAIREHPSDDLPRMAWADWLEENGRGERAELVRLQLALARGDDSGRTREQALLAEHGQRWLDEELPGFGLRMTHEWLRRDERDIPPSAAFRRGVPAVFFVELEGLEGVRSRTVAPARIQFLGSWPDEMEDGKCRWEYYESEESILHDLYDMLQDSGDYANWKDALKDLSRAATFSCIGIAMLPFWRDRWSPRDVGNFLAALPTEVAKQFIWDKAKSGSPDSDYYSISREALRQYFRNLGYPVDNLINPWSGDLESVR